jgi:hypothetical protein
MTFILIIEPWFIRSLIEVLLVYQVPEVIQTSNSTQFSKYHRLLKKYSSSKIEIVNKENFKGIHAIS